MLPIPLLEDTFHYYPPIYVWVFQVVNFPSGFATKTLYTPLLSPMRAICLADLIIINLIIRIILVRSYWKVLMILYPQLLEGLIQINQPTRCNNSSSLLLDVYVQLNMFRASSRPSSGAQLQ